jgi:CheY-like chemotaxis protein
MNPKALIFVVDDEPLLIELAAAILEPVGYQVRTFQDPAKALAAFAASDPAPDLLITDFAMHQLTGLDLMKQCRQLHPGQKVLLVSGTVDEEIYRDSRVRPDAFLAKPYESKQLIHHVESLLKRI